MWDKCGRWMEGKKRVIPGEICAECPERDNRCRETSLNAQKSAEAIVAGTRRAESVGVLITTEPANKKSRLK